MVSFCFTGKAKEVLIVQQRIKIAGRKYLHINEFLKIINHSLQMYRFLIKKSVYWLHLSGKPAKSVDLAKIRNGKENV